MSFTRIARQTVTVIRPGSSPGNDDYGNVIPGTPETHDIPGCVFQPLSALGVSSSEETLTSFADQVVTRWRGYAPAGADIVVTDHIQVDGDDYSVDGDPVVWARPNGIVHHVEFFAMRWKG